MTEQNIKEHLSRNFLRIVAHNKKFNCQDIDDDFGVDVCLQYNLLIDNNGKKRFLKSDKSIEVQLKAACDNVIIFEDDKIKYDLESKTFNDLVERKSGITPFILVLYILPEDINQCVEVNEEELILRRKAYWYHPGFDAKKTTNASRIRIEIPIENKIDINFCNFIFKYFFDNV